MASVAHVAVAAVGTAASHMPPCAPVTPGVRDGAAAAAESWSEATVRESM